MNHRRGLLLPLLCLIALFSLTACGVPSDQPGQSPPAIDEELAQNPAGYYFDFAIANRFDFVPEFAEGEAPTSSAPYLWYAFMLQTDKGQDTMSKEYVERTIYDHFEVKEVSHQAQAGEWDFDGDVYRSVPTSYPYEPIYGLKELNTYNKDGVTVYNLLMEQYTFEEFSWESPFDYVPAADHSNVTSPEMEYVLRKYGKQIQDGELTVAQAIRQMISDGDVGQFRAGMEEWFQYYLDAKTGKVVFVEHTFLDPGTNQAEAQ